MCLDNVNLWHLRCNTVR